MKRYMPYLLLAAMLFPAAVFAEEENFGEEEGMMMLERAERQVQMTNMQLEQKRAELDFKFEERMRELELEKMDIEIEHGRRQIGGHGKGKPEGIMCIFLLIGIINRILAPIWIHKDIHQRNAGSGMWIWFGILGGLFGLLTYAVVRLGDIKATGTAKTRK